MNESNEDSGSTNVLDLNKIMKSNKFSRNMNNKKFNTYDNAEPKPGNMATYQRNS